MWYNIYIMYCPNDMVHINKISINEGDKMVDSEDIYKPVAKTQGESGEDEIKKRNKKAMNLYNKDEAEIVYDSPGIIHRLPLLLDAEKRREEKTRKTAENNRAQQEERNVGLRIDPNGDTVTRRGNLIHDRAPQSMDKWKKDIDKYKKLEKAKLNESKRTKEERRKK